MKIVMITCFNKKAVRLIFIMKYETISTQICHNVGQDALDKKMSPPRSPDLTPCDFFLWGFLKDSPR